jgi:nitrogen fixation protein NifU and related proteins
MNLYQEEILDHYKHPRNKKRLEKTTRSVEVVNPLCGDKLGVEILIENNQIVDIGFWGEGCAISQASMSMITEELNGQSIERLHSLTKDEILELLGVSIGPARLKCALLPLQAVKKLLE